MSDSPVIAGCEPFSAPGGPHGALVIHGFTGNPHSMRGLAQAFADAGFAVELPRLPGHGTTVEDLQTTSWADWSATVEAAYQDLAGRSDKVVVAGLSMGGTLTVWLAERHPEIAGIVAINAAVDPPAESFLAMLRTMLEQGHEVMPAVGGDIAKPGTEELGAYGATPIRPLLSFVEQSDELVPRLGDITCPVLIVTSTNDHVVPPVSSDVLAAKVAGPVERIVLDRSFHVATVDWDKDEIERRAVEFARKVTAG
ncbi:MAG: esterase [Acidimicrobiales bacterium]|jgi:carboxylesterase|nr:esterase [Acidimicrobiales bacterium]